jgi:hypothetical protein
MQFMRERPMDVYMEDYKKTNSADDAEVQATSIQRRGSNISTN